MAKQLEGKRIAFLAADGFEQSELEQPWIEIKNAGATVELLSVHKGSIQGMRHMDKGDAEADVVRGRTVTSWPSLKTDIRNAGGEWVDEEVHVDRGS